MKIKVILNGGLKSCCKTYPTDMIRTALKSWFKGEQGIDTSVIDVQEENWTLDKLSSLAYRYFGDNIYPLVYLDDTLVAIGTLPDKHVFLTMINDQEKVGIHEQDIIEVAQKRGLIKGQE